MPKELRKRVILAITPGDPEGIGPEIVWKAVLGLHRHPRADAPVVLCIGARAPFVTLGAPIEEISLDELHPGWVPPKSKDARLLIVPAPTASERGRVFLPGFQSGWSIQTATRLVQRGVVDALVTGPISKERLNRGGFAYPGHTEFLAALCKVRRVTMMLANPTLRITLVTTHLALRDVPAALTRADLKRTILHTAGHLQDWWGIRRPRLAIAALNPHAGEAGLFGDEEIRIIAPTIRSLQNSHARDFEVIGPLPADTLFAKHVLAPESDRYDAVVCMYHDQGLIPVKLLDFPNTVNVTLGLPIIRTSVDHGVGFDIAGKGVADPSSLRAAIQMAVELVQNARRTKR